MFVSTGLGIPALKSIELNGCVELRGLDGLAVSVDSHTSENQRDVMLF